MKYPSKKKIQKIKPHAKFLTDKEIDFLTHLNKQDKIRLCKAYLQQLLRYRTYLQTAKSMILARRTARESRSVILSDKNEYNLDESYMFAFEKGHDSISQDYKNMDDIVKVLKNQLIHIKYVIDARKEMLKQLQKL